MPFRLLFLPFLPFLPFFLALRSFLPIFLILLTTFLSCFLIFLRALRLWWHDFFLGSAERRREEKGGILSEHL